MVEVVGAQQPGFSDLHQSVLYPLFVKRDFSMLADSNFACSVPQWERAGAKVLYLSLGLPEWTRKGTDTTSGSDIANFLVEFKTHCQNHYPQLEFAQNLADIPSIVETGKIALVLVLEGCGFLQGRLDLLDTLRSIGVLRMGIAHWFHNAFIIPKNSQSFDGKPLPIRPGSQLSAQGFDLLRRMYELGIALDVSHVQPGRLWEQLLEWNAGSRPLFVGHTGAYALCRHPRNLRLSQLRDLARCKAGRVGLCLHNPLIHSKRPTARKAARHIIYLARRLGWDRVCIGSDWAGNTNPPPGLRTPLEAQKNLMHWLRKLGVPSKRIEGILWRNALYTD